MMYNKKVYESLGTRDSDDVGRVHRNSEKIKAEGDGITPILQSYGDTWTSQLFVLGDFANVAKQDPNWADDYTEQQGEVRRRARVRGLRAHRRRCFDKGLMNEDYPSMTNAQAMEALATGAGAMYPMLTGTIATIQQNNPDKVDDIGVFALPAADAADTAITIWQPNGDLHPEDHRGRQARGGQEVRRVRELG